VTVPITSTIDHPAISGARIVAADGDRRLSIDIPVYPAATAFADSRHLNNDVASSSLPPRGPPESNRLRRC
jgi:hypothetical protein